jgi:hypothetical protein
LLLGAEEDWPQAFEAIAGRLGVFRYAGADHVLDTSGCTSTLQSAGSGPPSRGDRPVGLLVLPPAGVAEEGGVDG